MQGWHELCVRLMLHDKCFDCCCGFGARVGYVATAPEFSKHETSTHQKLEHWGFINTTKPQIHWLFHFKFTGTRLVQARSTQ
eukprot:1167230-Rhodomonas_salina.2